MGREAVAYYQNVYSPAVRYNRITAFQKRIVFFGKYSVLSMYEIGQVSRLEYSVL